jgi:RNA polymerase sigma-70 factor (ECF subfamily)
LVAHGTAGGRHRTASSSRLREEDRLMSLVRARDVQAFEALYRIYQPRLVRFLTSFVHRPPMVEEVVNDTMMVVWNRPDSFNGASKLSTWIFGIAYRKGLKALRRRDDPVEDAPRDRQASEDDDPEQELGRQKVQQALLKALDELSPDHRTVVNLTYFHHMGYREIAEIMDCPNDTVKTRMFHARRHLKRILAGELADWI